MDQHKLPTLLKSVLHVVGAVQFSFSVYYDWNYVVIPPHVSRMGSGFGGKFKFLTFWDAVLQSVYFTLCVVDDVLNTEDAGRRRLPWLRRLKDFTYAAVAFPIAMFVGLTFWCLMAIDRELVLPKALDPYFPNWLNHVMHTNIMVFTIMELLASYRRYPERKRGLAGLTAFMCVYLIWTHIIYFKSGEWVYPVLDVLNWGMRIVFFLALLLLGNILYLAGELLNSIVWGANLSSAPSSIAKTKRK